MLEIKTKIEFDPINLTDKHEKQSEWKKTVVCLADGDIDKYYAWFLERRFNLVLNRSIRKAHITIVADRITDKVKYQQAKEIFNGKEIIFTYDPEEIRSNGVDWWIKVYNTDIEAIREFAGLERKPFFNLHMTIGYAASEIRLEHSKYILQQILKFDL